MSQIRWSILQIIKSNNALLQRFVNCKFIKVLNGRCKMLLIFLVFLSVLYDSISFVYKPAIRKRIQVWAVFLNEWILWLLLFRRFFFVSVLSIVKGSVSFAIIFLNCEIRYYKWYSINILLIVFDVVVFVISVNVCHESVMWVVIYVLFVLVGEFTVL